MQNNIGKLKTSYEWKNLLYPELRIFDYDGWRDGLDFNTVLITKSDFEQRLISCTVMNIIEEQNNENK